MNPMFDQILTAMEADPGARGLTTDIPCPDLGQLGVSLLQSGTVFIVTGFPILRAGGVGETDGPGGAANLARVLSLLGKRVCVITDQSSYAFVREACRLYAPEAELCCVPSGGAPAFCRKLLADKRPTHVIAIERPGKGADGHYHNASGLVIDDYVSDTDGLLEAPGVVTVGIGDGGNELGMGALRDLICQRVPHGSTVCARAAADFTLTAGVSNWWGWGVAAVLSALTGRDLLPSDDAERALLQAVVDAGCVDGITGVAELTVDHLSLEENLSVLAALRQAVRQPDYAAMTPLQARRMFRDNSLVRQTSGMCAGYAQCNLIVLPSALAADFRAFAQRNPFACPVLEEAERGSRRLRRIAQDVDLARDFPKYRVYRDGVLTEEPLDVADLWNDDLTAFLIGCSFSFEDALLQAGVPVRHIEENRNVPMYLTQVDCVPAGIFSGKMVVSMRPMTPQQAEVARRVTAAMPRVHGAPIEIGDPRRIGVGDLSRPDFGQAVTIRPGEIPVFWPCGVTPQSVVMTAKPAFAITHAPGHMLIADVKNSSLMD